MVPKLQVLSDLNLEELKISPYNQAYTLYTQAILKLLIIYFSIIIP